MTSILVIDNVKSNRQILEKIVETIDPDIAVSNFESAMAAFSWLDFHAADLVITAYKPPTLDGLEFARRLRGHNRSPQIPILMIATTDDLALPIFAREAGVTAFLSRPVDHEIVRSRIINLLSQQGKRRHLQLIVDNAQVRGQI